MGRFSETIANAKREHDAIHKREQEDIARVEVLRQKQKAGIDEVVGLIREAEPDLEAQGINVQMAEKDPAQGTPSVEIQLIGARELVSVGGTSVPPGRGATVAFGFNAERYTVGFAGQTPTVVGGGAAEAVEYGLKHALETYYASTRRGF